MINDQIQTHSHCETGQLGAGINSAPSSNAAARLAKKLNLQLVSKNREKNQKNSLGFIMKL